MHERTVLLFPAALVACAGVVLGSLPASAAQPTTNPTASAVVTDQAKLAVKNMFSLPPNFLRVADDGNVLFQKNDALFRWTGGAPKRLLQSNDPMPGHLGGFVNTAGSAIQLNSAGHAAMYVGWAEKGMNAPYGIFVFNGSTYAKIALSGESAPGTGTLFRAWGGNLFINANDQVAFLGFSGTTAVSRAGVYRGKPGEAPMRIALAGEPAPGTAGTYASFTPRGLTDSGDVVFYAVVTESFNQSSKQYGVLYYWASGALEPTLIARPGDPAPETGERALANFNAGNVYVNRHGTVALLAGVSGEGAGRGIWVRSEGVWAKLVLNSDNCPLGDIYDGGLQIRGLNDNGQVLFSSNPPDEGHALFVKSLGADADVVFYRGQSEPGGSDDTFNSTVQATLNNSGAVAFLAQLQQSTTSVPFGPHGWYLWRPSPAGGSATKIIRQRDWLLGGEVGLMGRTGAPFALRLNGGNRFVFVADILGPNVTALLSWNDGAISTVAKTNDPLPAGASLVIRGAPRASDDEVLFQAFPPGGPVTHFTATLKGSVKIRRIVGEGDPAPDGGAIVNLGEAWINSRNTVSAFANVLKSTLDSYPWSAIYLSRPGTALQPIVATNDPVQTSGPTRFSGINTHRLNNNDQIAFFANLYDPGNPQGIFFIGGGGPAPVVVRGDSAPAGPPGSVFGSVQYSSGGRFALNDNGLVVFEALYGPPPNNTQDSYGLFARNMAGLHPPIEKIVADGDVLDAYKPTRSVFAEAYLPSVFKINNSGWFAYDGLTYPDGDGIHLWRGPGSGLPQILAQTGDPAPGGAIGALFSVMNGNLIDINSSGKVAFSAWVSPYGSTGASGYFLWDGANVRARLREGDPLPGGGFAGAVSQTMALSEAGEVAMGVSDITGAPLFARFVIADVTGKLRTFAAVGENANGTGSFFGWLISSLSANPSGRFFFPAALADQHVQSGIFASDPPKR